MDNMSVPKIAKWPFFLADVVLLYFAMVAMNHLGTPPGAAMVLVFILAVGLAGGLSVLPFLLEYRAALRLTESETLNDAVARIQQVEQLAGRIDLATSHWQTAHQLAEKTAATAGDIAARMAKETRAFTAFMEKSQDAEKSRMRLEIEKMRRSEGESLQIITGLLDHVFALQQAGARSGQPHLIEQLGHFQAACCDLARRIGLVPFVPEPNEPFNAEAHQPVDRQTAIPADARVVQVAATGYMYQGQLLRRALVVLAIPGENDPGTVTHTFAPVEAPIETPVQEMAPAGTSFPPATAEPLMPATDEEAYEVPPAPEEGPVDPPVQESEAVQSETRTAAPESATPMKDEEAFEVPPAIESHEEAQAPLTAAEETAEVVPPVTPEPAATPGDEKPASDTTPPAGKLPVELEFPAIAAELPPEQADAPKPPRRPSRQRPPSEQELF
jgi:molecular chaperone GrpE (heat shock protein)